MGHLSGKQRWRLARWRPRRRPAGGLMPPRQRRAVWLALRRAGGTKRVPRRRAVGPRRARPRRRQAGGLRGLAGGEFGGALEGTRGRGGAAPLLRLSSGFLEQGGHVLVGLQRGCGEVPGVAVGLIAECVRDLPVGGGALGERNSVIDRRADEGMGELWSRAVHPDQACLLGRGERFGGQPGYGRRRQVWAVGDRGKQQRLMR